MIEFLSDGIIPRAPLLCGPLGTCLTCLNGWSSPATALKEDAPYPAYALCPTLKQCWTLGCSWLAFEFTALPNALYAFSNIFQS